MSDIITTRNPDMIAAEINAIKRSTAKYVLQQSIEIGRLLVEAKEAVPYGSWGTWLETNCEYSTTNANNLMRIYTEYGSDVQLSFFEDNRLELYGNLNRSQAIALLSLPRQERDAFVKANNVPGMSVSELEEKIKAAKEETAAETEKRLRGEYEEKIAANDKIVERLKNSASDADKKAKKAEDDAKNSKKALDAAISEKDRVISERDRCVATITEMQLRIDESAKKQAGITKEQREAIIAEANLQTAEKMAGLEAEITRLKAASNPTVQKCAVYFESIQSSYISYTRLIDTESDEEIKAKIRKAFDTMIDKMKG
ncbi:MAG: DUF3102 domain-containing protein [Eubacteriales bacterium]